MAATLVAQACCMHTTPGSLIKERSPGALENQSSNQLLLLRVIYVFSREFSQ
jgi:hypothetical protein